MRKLLVSMLLLLSIIPYGFRNQTSKASGVEPLRPCEKQIMKADPGDVPNSVKCFGCIVETTLLFSIFSGQSDIKTFKYKDSLYIRWIFFMIELKRNRFVTLVRD